MTDHDPQLTRHQEQEVRRLLASARHDEPMPPAVAARLDGVLAGLGAEPGKPASVPGLAARRRRVAGLLLAAAAVVVVGVGLDRVLGPAIGPASESESVTADRQDGAAGDPAPGASEEGGPDAAGEAGPRDDTRLVRIRPQHLTDDLVATRAAVAKANGYADRAAPGALAAVCRSRTWGSGTFVPVRYGSQPAVLVLRRASGGTQVADLYRCGDVEPVRSVALPAP